MAPKRLLKGDEKGVSSLSPLVTSCWLSLALRPLRQVLIKVDNGLLSRGSPVRVWPGAPLPLKPIQSKGVTEIILHPWLHPRSSVFLTDGQRRQDSGVFLFLLSIQLLT